MEKWNITDCTDEELAAILQHGDIDAMSELYNRYHHLVFCKCYSFFQDENDALDATQDIMLKTYDKINSYQGKAKFSTWLFSITFNYCTDQLRKSKKHSFYSLEVLRHVRDSALEELEFTLEKERQFQLVNRALSSICDKDRELLLMKYGADKSIRELETIYQLSASAVKMRLLRAKEKACEAYDIAHVAA